MTAHKIEIACDTPDAEAFCDWLNESGHDAKIGASTANYVDGQRTTDYDAGEIMRGLWDEFCAH